MGWTSCDNWTTKQSVCAAILQDNAQYLVKHKCVGNELWTVLRDDSGMLILVVYILEKHGGTYSYKDLAESSHPYYYNCPQEFVDMVPASNPEWRNARFAYLAAKAHRKTLKARIQVGDSVTLSNGWTLTVDSLKPFTGIDSNGKRWRIPAKMLA